MHDNRPPKPRVAGSNPAAPTLEVDLTSSAPSRGVGRRRAYLALLRCGLKPLEARQALARARVQARVLLAREVVS